MYYNFGVGSARGDSARFDPSSMSRSLFFCPLQFVSLVPDGRRYLSGHSNHHVFLHLPMRFYQDYPQRDFEEDYMTHIGPAKDPQQNPKYTFVLD